MIEMKNISKAFEGKKVFEHRSFEFELEGVTAVLGPSGCGKSTLLRMIAGLETPDEGRITGVPEHIAFAFENDVLLPWLDVQRNVELAGCSADRAEEMLAAFGLEEATHERISALSGGMCRRVSLARALAFDKAELILLDEPTQRLNAELAQQVMETILEKAAGRPIIMVTHDGVSAEAFGDRLVKLT